MFKMSHLDNAGSMDFPDVRIPERDRHKYPVLMNRGKNMNTICPKFKHESCPAGHQGEACGDDKKRCVQCVEDTYQPDENWHTDKCLLKNSCRGKNHMYEADPGSTTKNRQCGCVDGYHFSSHQDQYKCHRNPTCDRGEAPGQYGGCESCLAKAMYSDTRSSVAPCKPLTNCEKQGKCIQVPSDGTYDNICGPKVIDLKTCKELESQSFPSDIAVIAIPIVAGVIGILLLIFLAVFFIRRKQYKSHYCLKKLTPEEYDELRQKIVKTSDKDPVFCKKALTTACSFVPERIGRQIWDLPRELFRAHPLSGAKYEQIVEKYKENHQPQSVVAGYLGEWRTWRGDTKGAVADMFHCLSLVKREDIGHEVCTCLRSDLEPSETMYPAHKNSFKDECIFIYFPCCYKTKDKSASLSPVSNMVVIEAEGEAGTKLLACPSDDVDDGGNDGGKSAGQVYRSHPSPSAPELDELPPSYISNPGFPQANDIKFANRQLSVPVQATS